MTYNDLCQIVKTWKKMCYSYHEIAMASKLDSESSGLSL